MNNLLKKYAKFPAKLLPTRAVLKRQNTINKPPNFQSKPLRKSETLGQRYWKDEYGLERSAFILNCLSCGIYMNDFRPEIIRCPGCTTVHNRLVTRERRERREQKKSFLS